MEAMWPSFGLPTATCISLWMASTESQSVGVEGPGKRLVVKRPKVVILKSWYVLCLRLLIVRQFIELWEGYLRWESSLKIVADKVGLRDGCAGFSWPPVCLSPGFLDLALEILSPKLVV